MRQPAYNKRKQKGCAGCGVVLFKFTFLLVIVAGLAFFLVNLYYETDVSDKIKRTQYPIKYEYFVEKYSQEYNLDKYLVYGVIRTESRFDKFAVSSADAKGLMQLTDETGRDCAKKVGISRYDENALFDPEINIQLGCYYLSNLIKIYNDKDVAIAAYNAGPGNVDKWLLDKAYTDGNGNLTEIPFSETKSYVKKVNEATAMYKSLYDNYN